MQGQILLILPSPQIFQNRCTQRSRRTRIFRKRRPCRFQISTSAKQRIGGDTSPTNTLLDALHTQTMLANQNAANVPELDLADLGLEPLVDIEDLHDGDVVRGSDSNSHALAPVAEAATALVFASSVPVSLTDMCQLSL